MSKKSPTFPNIFLEIVDSLEGKSIGRLNRKKGGFAVLGKAIATPLLFSFFNISSLLQPQRKVISSPKNISSPIWLRVRDHHQHRDQTGLPARYRCATGRRLRHARPAVAFTNFSPPGELTNNHFSSSPSSIEKILPL